jgi:disulfide bond formation protein DsbB
MDASQVADVGGTVVTAGLLAVAALAVLAVAAPARAAEVRERLAPGALGLAALVAVAATLGSLWYSEGAHFPPCELCWYQRIAMYPLAVLLPVAAWRRDHGIRLYAALLAGGGLAVSLWHNYIETFPHRDPGGCDPTNPCTIRWVEGLGFWTIPRMALACFVLILALLALDRRDRRDRPSADPTADPTAQEASR